MIIKYSTIIFGTPCILSSTLFALSIYKIKNIRYGIVITDIKKNAVLQYKYNMC